MKQILLTGSNGFVGSYFINNYDLKYDIKTFSFLKDDYETLHIKNVDAVLHLSALVHQMDGAIADEYERVNVKQTLDLAKKAKENGVKQFVFMSTVAVYGIEIGMMHENSNCKPITNYGKSKLKAEQELQKLEDDDFIVSIIRSPIVNGHNTPGNMKSLINLVKKIQILPFGCITNKRSMVYVGNLCHLINQIIKQKSSGVFLANDNEPISTTKLCELIAHNLDKRLFLVKIPFFESILKLVKPSFHKRLYESLEVDNSETMKKLNLKNPYSLEEGILYMVNNKADFDK